MEDDLNRRRPQWKMTSMKKTSMEDNLNGRLAQGKTTTPKDNMNIR